MAEYRILPVLCKRAPNHALESEAVLQRDKKNAHMLKGRTGYVISEEGPFAKERTVFRTFAPEYGFKKTLSLAKVACRQIRHFTFALAFGV